MSNFIYSEDLQISLVIHRLKNIFATLEIENVNQYTFAPSLVYNETFWLLPQEKRKNIITELPHEWVGDGPLYGNYFIKNYEIIEKLELMKQIYLNWGSIKLQTLIEILSSPSSYQITDFLSCGDLSEVRQILNELNTRDVNFQYQESLFQSIMGRTLAPRILSNLSDKSKDYRVLLLSYYASLELWNSFCEEIIKKFKQTQRYIKFDFVIISKAHYEYIKKELKKYPYIYKAIRSGIVNFDQISVYNLDEFTKTNQREYDYVMLENVLSFLPVDLLYKKGKDIFERKIRIIYLKNLNDKQNYSQYKKEIKQIKKLIKIGQTSPVDYNNLIQNWGYEFVWFDYHKEDIKEILINHKLIYEETIFPIPLIGIALIINLINLIKVRNGFIEILDTFDFTGLLKGIYEDNNKYQRIYSNYNLYKAILENLSDINVRLKFHSAESIITNLPNNKAKNCLIRLEHIIELLTSNPQAVTDFLITEMFTFGEKIKQIAQKYKSFWFLKSKNFFLFGLASLLYYIGFKKFLKELVQVVNLDTLKNIEYTKMRVKWLNSYEKEFLIEVVPQIILSLAKHSDMLVPLEDDLSRYLNSQSLPGLKDLKQKFEELLIKNHINLESFYAFIKKHRNNLLYSSLNSQANYGIAVIKPS